MRVDACRLRLGVVSAPGRETTPLRLTAYSVRAVHSLGTTRDAHGFDHVLDVLRRLLRDLVDNEGDDEVDHGTDRTEGAAIERMIALLAGVGKAPVEGIDRGAVLPRDGEVQRVAGS